jgi:hypothetical protein
MQLDRRTFLKSGLVAGTAVAGVGGLLARPSLSKRELARDAANAQGGYGPLKPTPSKNTGETILALPEGFQYTVFGKTGSMMSDGRKTPGLHDGMAAFGYKGRVRLIRNHEVRDKPGQAIGAPERSYDHVAGGGTTTLEVDPKTRELVRDFVSLSGTMVNCAGGPTPWGSWLSCEETVIGNATGQVYHKETAPGGGYAKEHGYVFEVSVLEDGAVNPVALKAMGRFVHEASAVDPVTGIVYLTEDFKSAGFYRFIPDVPTKLAEGGRLQMLKVKDRPDLDTRKGMAASAMKPMRAEWVDIKDPDPAGTHNKPLAVFEQGKAQGAATFGRLEGCWYGDGCIYLNSTDGGDANAGQIWRYRPMGAKGGELTLLFESPNKDVLDAPDNLCVSPRGGLVICEDGGGDNYVRGLTQDGRLFDVALNVLNKSEVAGATFSPDGETLFFNLQSPGLTVAVWGPWERGAL